MARTPDADRPAPDEPGARHPEGATTPALVRYFARLGLLGFGGPVALAGYMQRDLVDERGWISPQEYRDGLAIAQMAPGPLAAQLAMWLAFVRQGARGATLASFAFIGPPFLVVVALGWLYVGLGGTTLIESLFYGIGPAATAIIALATVRLARLTVGRDPLLVAVMLAIGLWTYLARSEIAVLFLLAGLFVLVARTRPWERTGHPGAAAGIAFLGPLLPAGALQLPLLANLALFFVTAGAFVFGSGLAIVPFLHQGIVVEHHWLTERQFLDSVAVGLISPGPVVIAAAFIGFLVAGLPGALIGAFGVFLPVYLFVILPGRWFLRHLGSPRIRAFVAGVTAAATGAIGAASVILGQEAIRDWATVGIGLGALAILLLLGRRKVRYLSPYREPLVVALAGLAGLLLAHP